MCYDFLFGTKKNSKLCFNYVNGSVKNEEEFPLVINFNIYAYLQINSN